MRLDLRLSTRRAPIVLVLLLAVVAGCARRTPPPALPTAVTHPDFMYPAIPQALQRAPGIEHIDPGWRYLQNNDLRNASREFAAALKRNPGLYPAHVGDGYVAIARNEHEQAVAAFDAALRAEARYVPALVGRGQALLALRREGEALASFEAALAADPALTDVRRRVEVLRFRNVQQTIEAAREAAAAGRAADARLAYQRALSLTPESAFLHRELAALEQRQGNADAALDHYRRAAALDAFDAASVTAIGDLLAQRRDFAAAEEAYRKAAAIEPSEALTAKIAEITTRAREARLPAEFHAIPGAGQVTRGDLAALLGVRLQNVLGAAVPRQAVVTDAGGHWAAEWITDVVEAGVIDPFENHTFQPGSAVRRGDLATAVSRIATILAATNAALRARIAQRPAIADMPQGHLRYPAASVAVASGVMPLLDGNRFQVNRVVTGKEAVETIERLRALAESAS